MLRLLAIPLALVALGGTVVAASLRGAREIAADEFFVGHFTTALEPDELVLETVWPALGHGWGVAFEELALRAGDYALGMAAVTVRAEGVSVANAGGGSEWRVAEARVAIGANVDRPTLLPDVSALVNGRYDLVPIPDPSLGPRHVDVATMYNTARLRPLYTDKRGLPVFLNSP